MTAHSFGAHPLTAVGIVKRLLPLLIIPVAGSIYRYVMYGYSFSSTLWDVLGAAASVTWGIIEYKSIKIKVAQGKVFVTSGALFKSSWQVSTNHIAAIYTEVSPFSALFGAVKVRLETVAGLGKKADLVLYMRRAEAARFVAAVTGFKGSKAKKSTFLQSLLLALSETSALSGLIIFATAVNYLGRFFGRRIDEAVIESITDGAKRLGLVLPRAATFLAVMILLGVGLSFGMAAVRHTSIAIEQNSKIILIKQGLIWRSATYVFKEQIPSFMTVSTPVLALFGRKNVCVNVGGFGSKQDAETILPAVKNISSNNNNYSFAVTCPKSACGRAIRIPLILALLTFALWALALWHMPQLGGLWAMLFASTAAACLYRLRVKLKAVRSGGVFVGKRVKILYPSRLTYYEGETDLSHIDSVILRQTPFDFGKSTCRLIVNVHNKQKSRFGAAYLDIDEAENFTSFL